jgi:hypothetical protein
MRLGSLTQAPRQMTRFGANMVPMCGHGLTLLKGVTGQELVSGLRLNMGAMTLGHMQGGVIFKKPVFLGSFGLSGVTRDSSGAALAGCIVRLFRTSAFDEKLAETVSDASGNYTFKLADNSGTFWLAVYKPGAPDVAGTSVRNLVAV